LIFPFEVELWRLDTIGTAADPDEGGPLTSGVDPDFREPIMLPRVGRDALLNRRELAPIILPCQVEEETEDEQMQRAAGDDPATLMRFVFHFQDLEDLDLVDQDGKAMLNKNDRVTAIFLRQDGSLVQRFDDVNDGSGGLFCTAVEPRSFGLGGLQRNLLVATFKRRGKTP